MCLCVCVGGGGGKVFRDCGGSRLASGDLGGTVNGFIVVIYRFVRVY